MKFCSTPKKGTIYVMFICQRLEDYCAKGKQLCVLRTWRQFLREYQVGVGDKEKRNTRSVG